MVFLDPSHSDFVLDRSRASLRRAPARSKPTSLSERTVTAARQVLEGQPLSRHRYLAFTAPAIVASIAYMDPGNFATNVQAGAKYGYSLLWVVLLANLVAMLFQGLSAKLGILLEVAEVDFELKAGLCPCERRAGHAEIARPSSSTRTIGVPGLTIARWVVSARRPGAPSSPQTGDGGFAAPLLCPAHLAFL
jgi:hypothetical protein